MLPVSSSELSFGLRRPLGDAGWLGRLAAEAHGGRDFAEGLGEAVNDALGLGVAVGVALGVEEGVAVAVGDVLGCAKASVGVGEAVIAPALVFG